MLTQFQTQKLTHLFNLYDVDGNGLLEEQDYARISQNGAYALGYQPGTAEYTNLHTAYMGMWQEAKQLADSDNDGQLTLTEFITAYDQLMDQKAIFTAAILEMVKTITGFLDRDKDGKIEEAEYVAYDMAHNLSREEAIKAFRRIDRDGDGYLTREELLQAIEDFFYSDDPRSPGNWFLGPF